MTIKRWWTGLALVGLTAFGAAQSAQQGQSQGWTTLFDGSSLDGWTMAGPGGFKLLGDGSMVSEGGLGLFYYEPQTFRDFELVLEWKVDDAEAANSGVFVRFPEKSDDPFYAVDNGYEIQIDDTDAPDRYTGAVYSFAAPTKLNSKPVGEWNTYRIRVVGQRYEIFLNGDKVNDFFGDRGREGYIGLQNHDPGSKVYFRDVRVRPVQNAQVFESIGEMFAAEGEKTRTLVFTGASGERDEAAAATVETARDTLADLSGKTEFQIDLLGDAGKLTAETLADYDLLVFANTSGDIPLGDDQKAAIRDFLRNGKGFVGTASAAATNTRWADYREMLGGGLVDPEADAETLSMTMVAEDPQNPALAPFDETFTLTDTLYTFDTNPRWNSHVLASVDTASIGVPQGPADSSSNDYPVAWCRTYNGGRVFYTALGGSSGMWRDPAFVAHLLGGMRVAAGLTEADCSGHRVKETIAENIWPDDIAVDARGNVWIAELRGKLHRYDARTGKTEQIALIETTDPTNIEHGLYGVEVDPAFYDGEPYVYLYYAEPVTFINMLIRVPWRDGKLVRAEEQVILRVPTEPQCCHQAGDLEWGPDGKLYVSTGDTGFSEVYPDWEISDERIQAFLARNNLDGYNWSRLADSERTAQNLQDLRGKVLRLNKDGSIPKDNPFFGQPGVRWEIFAYGLRNPYRIQSDPETGCIYIGVVGPDEDVTFDEYNVACEGGENFGWPRDTGQLLYNEWTAKDIPNQVMPLWEYTYETGGRSASGGPVYRYSGEGAFPAAFQDKVFIYDWSRRWIKWADVQGGRFTNIKNFDTLADTAPISMELGPDGSLYVAEFTGFWDPAPGAKVTRYRWASGNEAPVAEAAAAPFSGQAPLQVAFNSDGAYDPDADTISYAWDFGDGATSTDPNPTHTYAENGLYTATLVTTDAQGLKSPPETLEVTVGNTAPTPRIASLPAGALVEPTVPVRLTAQGTDPEDGELAPENFAWTVTRLSEDEAGVVQEQEVASFTGAEGELPMSEEADWNSSAEYRVTLTASDSEGLSQTTEQTVRLTRLQAEAYNGVAGFQVEVFSDEEGDEGEQVYATTPGDYLAWTDVNLTGRSPAFVRAAPGTTGGVLELRTGGAAGELLGRAEVTGDADAWQTVQIPFERTQGVNDLYLVAKPLAGDAADDTVDLRVNWLQLVGPGVRGSRVSTTAAQPPEQTTEQPEQSAESAAPEAEATTEATPTGGAASMGTSAEGEQVDLEAGRTVFENNCTTCHAASGEAVPGAYPPLVGHVPELYDAEGGREYLTNLLLYGLQGEIQVDGETYSGVMPAWQQLSDQQLADVLDYILSDWATRTRFPNLRPTRRRTSLRSATRA